MSRIILFIVIFCFSCNQFDKEKNERIAQSDSTDSNIGIVDSDNLKASVKSDDYYENMKSDSQKISEFVPAGYKIMDSIKGDLNKDEFQDLVLVLRSEHENAQDTTQLNRPLLLLIGNIEGNFSLVARNDSTVYCSICGGAMGDPYQEIIIKNGNFSIEHYGGSGIRWERVITYKYNPKENNWYLFKDGHVSFHATDPEKREEQVFTSKDFGIVKFEDFSIYK